MRCRPKSLPSCVRSKLAGLAALVLFSGSAPAQEDGGRVLVLEVSGGIGAATREYVLSGIETANERNAQLVVINLDTPGGLMNSTRDIITGILNSSVPVATYVTPAGARADSAGTFIMFASHVAAMAPTTHLGAATPVNLTGDDATPPRRNPLSPPPVEPPPAKDGSEGTESTDEPAERDASPAGTAMERKVLNDAVSYIRGLAERHGRNADWAEKAVVEAATLTAEEALEQNVIDLIASSLPELLDAIDGREVALDSGAVTLATAGAEIERFEPNWRIKLLSVIAQPEIVLLLGIVGVYGLLFEGYNPGAVVPGVVGIICLLLAAYALQVLPVNYAGLALILVGLALMVAEAFAPSFGALGLGGIAAFVFGAILMFDSDVPGFGISLTFVIGLALFAALFIVWMVSYLLKLRKRGAVFGAESLVGGAGTAMESFEGDGKIWIQGEAWAAHSKVPIDKGQEVVVVAMNGLTLEVEPAEAADTEGAQYQT